jgi:hypothetical protein
VPRAIHLSLKLDPDREPIAGVLSSQHHPDRSFDGWLELASAIEDARNTATPLTTARTPRSDATSTRSP